MNKINLKVLLFLFFLAIASGLFWGWGNFGKDPVQIGGDEEYYNRLALEYVNYGQFVSYRTDLARAPVDPLYPLFIAEVYRAFSIRYDFVRVIQLLFFSFTVLLIYFLARKIIGTRAGIVAAALSALYYPLAAFTTRFNKEVLFTFLLVLLVYSLQEAFRTEKIYWFVFAAVSFFLVYLINSIILFFPFFVILGYFLIVGRSFFTRQKILRIAVFFILSIIGPGYVFFSQRLLSEAKGVSGGVFLDRKIAIVKELDSDLAGYLNHLLGLTIGYYFAEKINPQINYELFFDYFPAAEKFKEARERGKSYKEFADNLNKEIAREIKAHWLGFFVVSFYDFLQFNGPIMPNRIISSGGPMQNMFIYNTHPEISGFLKIIILLGLRLIYWLFFGLVFYGIIKTRKQWKNYLVIYLLVIYFNAVFSVLCGLPRYAMPIYPFYIIFAVAGFLSLPIIQRLKIKKFSVYCYYNKEE